MAGELSPSLWMIVTVTVAAFAVLAIGRPWRFLRQRRSCPQCRKLLPRWDRWGWIEIWTCSRCGCQVGR